MTTTKQAKNDPEALRQSYRDKMSMLAEALHTGWRKGADCPHAMPIHRLISECADEDAGWGEYLEWVDWCLGVVGYEPTTDAERREGNGKDDD